MSDRNSYFIANVYFKPKKYDQNKVIFRPLHTASLIDQIAMTAMLQILVYDIGKNNKLILSEMSRILPDCFYGNRISTDGMHLFKPWQDQYQAYSVNANKALINYAQTHEYGYEVNLDLIDFFPSVNPQVLYNILQTYIPVHLSGEDRETLCTIFQKLLIIRLHSLDEQEWAWYAGDEIPFPNTIYVKGIPQGLPHSYFLANIVMVQIRRIYQNNLPGDMYFYVDDSVIFTNWEANEINESKFACIIRKINNEIDESLSYSELVDWHLIPFDYSYTNSHFHIRVHDDDKSTYYSIDDAAAHNGELHLRSLSRESSKIGFDIFSAYSEEDIGALHSRTKAICQSISSELQRVSAKVKNTAYCERLQRYKRFFDYREKILQIRKAGNVTTLLKTVVKELEKASDNSLAEFMHQYSEESLSSLIWYTYRMCLLHDIDISDLRNVIASLESQMYDGHTQHAYMSKAIANNSIVDDVDCYATVTLSAKRKYRKYIDVPSRNQFDEIKKLLSEEITKEYSAIFGELGFQELYSWSSLVRANNDRLIKMLLNSIVSVILNYTVNDSFSFSKVGRDPISYAEIRILSWLRSKTGSLREMHYRFESFASEDYSCAIDYSILQVIDRFHVYVNKPEWIDQLILIHKYCCDTWRNGSKYLYFYTLHNQEHAITLIHNIIKIVHAISHLQINQHDYFILFSACYLHDISMVSLPNFKAFYTSTDKDALTIYSECKQVMSDKSTSDMKGKYELCKAYREMETYFEKQIRDSHASNSASDIRRYGELSFIDSATREQIALVSEAHCAKMEDVYNERDKIQGQLIHKKQISILLRLADLLDMNSGRVSTVLLNHNLKDMPPISRFHWISHLVTKSCSLKSEYAFQNKHARKDFQSHIAKDAIKEKIILTIDVAMSQMTQVQKSRKCDCIKKCTYNLTDGDTGLEIIIDKGFCCNNATCCFLCKWFMLKNNYLVPELSIMNSYLSELTNNIFAPEIKILVRVVEDSSLPSEVFDYLREYVENGP